MRALRRSASRPAASGKPGAGCIDALLLSGSSSPSPNLPFTLLCPFHICSYHMVGLHLKASKPSAAGRCQWCIRRPPPSAAPGLPFSVFPSYTTGPSWRRCRCHKANGRSPCHRRRPRCAHSPSPRRVRASDSSGRSSRSRPPTSGAVRPTCRVGCPQLRTCCSACRRHSPSPQARRLVSAAARRRRCFLQSETGQQKRPQRVAQSQLYREAWS